MGLSKQQRGMSRRAGRAETECERLRELLAIARRCLVRVRASMLEWDDGAEHFAGDVEAIDVALRRSDPDVTPEKTTDAD